MFRILAIVFIFLISCKPQQEITAKDVQIAFIADAHFADIYGEFQDNAYKGIKNPVTGDYANIRTMSSQLQSTRIFNENYFALIAALNDVANRGIKVVALPGDFSDDGQPIHIRGLKQLLNEYSLKYGISFYVTTGNHDAVKPFAQNAKKIDFLGQGGKEQIITSSKTNSNSYENELAPIITSDIKNWGYKEMMNEMSDFGFYPKANDLYWETPFSNYSYDDYSYKMALNESALAQRTYPIKNTNLTIPDASYLVEPVPDVWLMAIDANVYVPKEKLSGAKDNPDDYSGASIGYNNVLLYKSHLINWVRKVVDEAKKNGKILIAFSHYPMVDFNDDASPDLKQFFGADKMQLHRVPSEDVAQVFADAGIQIHFGGHMHMNDTGVRTTNKGNTLYNIQTPSLAAYMPAYKLLTIHTPTVLEVETIVVNFENNLTRLFPLYEKEYKHLQETHDAKIWDKGILKSSTYTSFLEWHLKALVQHRFLKDDFPVAFLESFLSQSGKDLVLIRNSLEQVDQELQAKGLTLSDFEQWTGNEMLFDFFRIRNADELAIDKIGEKRMLQYKIVCEQLLGSGNEAFVLWSKIFRKTSIGQPSNHFKIDLKTDRIIGL